MENKALKAVRDEARARVVLVVFLVLAILCTTFIYFDAETGARLIRPVMMPILLVWAILRLDRGAPGELVAGLGLATVGDICLQIPGSLFFLMAMLLFLLMHVLYAQGFVELGAWRVVRANWWLPVLYLVAWLAANAFLGPQVGRLAIPVAVYSAALVVMATLAAGISPVAGLGGLLFVLSSAFIGFSVADLRFNLNVPIELCYLFGQLFIVAGWVELLDRQVFKGHRPVPAQES